MEEKRRLVCKSVELGGMHLNAHSEPSVPSPAGDGATQVDV